MSEQSTEEAPKFGVAPADTVKWAQQFAVDRQAELAERERQAKLDKWQSFGNNFAARVGDGVTGALPVSRIAGADDVAGDTVARWKQQTDEGERVQREWKEQADARERARREAAEAADRAFLDARAKALAERKFVQIDANKFDSIKADLVEIEQHQQRISTLIARINRDLG